VLKTVLDELPWRLPSVGPFQDVYDRANTILARLLKDQMQLVHFDLHFGNVKIRKGKMSVFDFDDCVFTHPAHDAAQAMYYLRREGINDRLEEAFWRGAGTTVEQMGVTREEFEYLVGARGVLLATDLLGTKNADLAAMAERYVEVTRKRLEHLLRTGEFDVRVASFKNS
jgi:hypothetical protein